MIWQDILISIVMVFFTYALIPQVIKGFKEKRRTIAIQTSLITFIGMFVLCFAYTTLNLYFSSIIAFLTGTLWLILFIQGIIYKK